MLNVAKIMVSQPDYVERLKKSFKAGNPLSPSLLPYCEGKACAETYRFSIQEGSPDCFRHPQLYAHLLLERILEEPDEAILDEDGNVVEKGPRQIGSFRNPGSNRHLR